MEKVDKLKIIKEVDKKGKDRRFLVECDCGKVFGIDYCNLYRKTRKIKQCKDCANKYLSEARRKTNKHVIKNDIIECYTEKDELFIIDKDDFWLLENYYWRLDSKGYCVADKRNCKDKSKVRMHQLIAEKKYGLYDRCTLVPDHLNRIKSDNRKSNIELKNNSRKLQEPVPWKKKQNR